MTNGSTLGRFRDDLPRFLEPLLILRRLLPAFVGRAGADQVHVGAEVLAVLSLRLAGTALGEAEIVWW